MKQTLHVKTSAILVAALFLSTFGAVWYGVIFTDLQMEAHRYTAAEYAASHPAWYAGGVVIALFIAWGLATVFRLGGEPGVKGGVRAGLRAVVGFGLPLITYPLVYSPLHELKLYAVGASQIIIAWIIAGAIIGAMNPGQSSRG